MGLVALIGNAFKALAAFCGWGKQRDAEMNTPQQQSNAQAQQIQKDRDKAATDIKNPNQTNLDRDIAP